MKKILTFILTASFSVAFSQKDYTEIYNTDKIIQNGVALYDDGKYEESLKELKKITPIDPRYLAAQHEITLSLSRLKRFDELRALFENLYKNNRMPEQLDLFSSYGTFLSEQNEFAESEKIYLEGKALQPNNSSLSYNLAVLYVKMEQQQKAVDILKEIITNDPNHASSHYLLGGLAFDNGRITEGTLALMTYLVLQPTGRFAKESIIKLGSKYGENYLEPGKVEFSKSGDQYEEIETILRNQLPLKSAYKVKSDFDDIIIRQIQAVAEYSVDHKIADGFFETTYMPWIKDMMNKNQFENYSYYILLSLETQLGKKLVSKKKKILSFSSDFLATSFWNIFATHKLDVFGKQHEVTIVYKDDHPYLLGPTIDGKREGKHKLLDAYGNLDGELNFTNNELNGLQKYFEKGQLSEERNYVNGKREGTNTFYFSNET